MQHQLFSGDQGQPQDLITRQFGITKSTLEQFSAEVKKALPRVNISFALILKNLVRLRDKYKTRNQADYFEEVLLHPAHHLVILAYCTEVGEIARRFVPEEELAFYEDIVLHLDSDSLFRHLATPVQLSTPTQTTGKLRYFSTKEYPREDNWQEVSKREGFVPEKAVLRADVSTWLTRYNTYKLTNYFLLPKHEFVTNLNYDLAKLILKNGSIENVKTVFRLLDKLLLSTNAGYHHVFEILASNPRIAPEYIYELLQQFPLDGVNLNLSSHFLRKLLKNYS